MSKTSEREFQKTTKNKKTFENGKKKCRKFFSQNSSLFLKRKKYFPFSPGKSTLKNFNFTIQQK